MYTLSLIEDFLIEPLLSVLTDTFSKPGFGTIPNALVCSYPEMFTLEDCGVNDWFLTFPVNDDIPPYSTFFLANSIPDSVVSAIPIAFNLSSLMDTPDANLTQEVWEFKNARSSVDL